MGVKTLFLVIVLLFLVFFVSYVVVSEETAETRVYFIETNYVEPKMMEFTVPQEPSGYDMLVQAMSGARDARRRNLRYERMEEEIDKCLERKTKNWKITYSRRSCEVVYEDGKWKEENCFWDKERSYFGYDEEDEDYLRWKLRQRWLNGEEIC